MYLSRLSLNRSRVACQWAANPYRIHQRLMKACQGDLRLLFRLEEAPGGGLQVLVQSHQAPDWEQAFEDLAVLAKPPQTKPFQVVLQAGGRYHFRLLANPTVKKTVERPAEASKTGPHKTRQGVLDEAGQQAWLERKLESAGAGLLGCRIIPRGLLHSWRSNVKTSAIQTHLAVLYEGMLVCNDPIRLQAALEAGLGPAKGYGFGLLSLAPA